MSKSNVILINAENNKAYSLLTSKSLDNAALSEFLITKCTKYLGVTFHNSLPFDLHINNLAKNLPRLVEISAKIKAYLTTKALISLYYAIFHLHLQYAFKHVIIFFFCIKI